MVSCGLGTGIAGSLLTRLRIKPAARDADKLSPGPYVTVVGRH
jgi:hypothetical protein